MPVERLTKAIASMIEELKKMDVRLASQERRLARQEVLMRVLLVIGVAEMIVGAGRAVGAW